MMLCTVGRRLVDRGAGKVIYSQMIKCLSEKNLEPKETYWSWGKDVDNSFKQMPTEPSTTIGTIVGKHVWTGFAFFFFFGRKAECGSFKARRHYWYLSHFTHMLTLRACVSELLCLRTSSSATRTYAVHEQGCLDVKDLMPPGKLQQNKRQKTVDKSSTSLPIEGKFWGKF